MFEEWPLFCLGCSYYNYFMDLFKLVSTLHPEVINSARKSGAIQKSLEQLSFESERKTQNKIEEIKREFQKEQSALLRQIKAMEETNALLSTQLKTAQEASKKAETDSKRARLTSIISIAISVLSVLVPILFHFL